MRRVSVYGNTMSKQAQCRVRPRLSVALDLLLLHLLLGVRNHLGHLVLVGLRRRGERVGALGRGTLFGSAPEVVIAVRALAPGSSITNTRRLMADQPARWLLLNTRTPLTSPRFRARLTLSVSAHTDAWRRRRMIQRRSSAWSHDPPCLGHLVVGAAAARVVPVLAARLILNGGSLRTTTATARPTLNGGKNDIGRWAHAHATVWSTPSPRVCHEHPPREQPPSREVVLRLRSSRCS